MRLLTEYCRFLNVTTNRDYAPYVYLDEWDERCGNALSRGLRLSLHPHMFRPIQTLQEANAILARFDANRYPNLQLLPDTAHLTIAGEDPVDVVKTQFDRIGAVHIKDWSPNVGRSYQFYASGFCQLGQGEVELTAVLDVLWKRSFKGWIVVEQDYSASPYDCIVASMNWLRTKLPPTCFASL